MEEKVDILLATFKPNIDYLKQQIDSILNQTHKKFSLHISDDFSNDKEVMLDAVNIDGQELYYASEQLRDDYDVVLAAVTKKGLILKYASKRLRANKEIVLAAIKSDKRAFDFISDENLKEDEEIKGILEDK